MKMRRWLIGTCAVVQCVACDSGSDADPWLGRREVIEGIEVIRNPAASVEETRTLSEALWEAPTQEDVAAFGEWEQPSSLIITEDHVYVLDAMAHRIYRLSRATGRIETAFGQRGRGPGEFEVPFGIALNGEGILVVNGGGRSIEVFRPDGTHERTVPLGGRGFGIVSAGGEVFANVLIGAEGGWRRLAEGGELELVHWPNPLAFSMEECERLHGGDVLIRSSCVQPMAQVLTAEGDVIREIIIDRPVAEIDDRIVDGYLSNVRGLMTESGMPGAQIEAMVASERERLKRVPAYRGARRDPVTGSIALWKQLPEDLGDEPARLHFVNGNGEFVRDLESSEAWADFGLRASVAYALARDPATGLVSLKALSLE